MGKRLRSVAVVLSLSVALFACLELVVRVFLAQDVRTTTGDSLGVVVPDPVVGHRNRPGVVARQRTPEYNVVYTVDEHGFRSGSRLNPTDSVGTTVLIVGDSFTFGIGSDDQNTWPRALEESLKRMGSNVRVFNAGVPGYDTRREVMAIERLLVKLKPDWVLVAFLPNDLFSFSRGGGRPAVVPRGTKSPPLHLLILLQRMLLESDAFYIRAYRTSGRAAIFQSQPSQTVADVRDGVDSLLAQANRVSTQAGARFAVVSIPQLFQVLASGRGKSVADYDEHILDKWLSAAASRHGFERIATLDTLAVADSTGDAPLYYRYDGHLTPTGNRIVGSYVAVRLRRLMGEDLFARTVESPHL